SARRTPRPCRCPERSAAQARRSPGAAPRPRAPVCRSPSSSPLVLVSTPPVTPRILARQRRGERVGEQADGRQLDFGRAALLVAGRSAAAGTGGTGLGLRCPGFLARRRADRRDAPFDGRAGPR